MKQPTVVIPLRAGKTRLAGAYDERARRDLRGAMLADVVAAVRAAHLDRIVVACADDESAELADGLSVEVERDPPEVDGLDAAIAHTVEVAGRERPKDDVMVVTADLPGLTANDVRAVLYAPGLVVIAPTGDGGTGILLRRPHDVIDTAYGQESAARHAARALDKGILPSVLELPGVRVDVDTEDDVIDLDGLRTLGEHTARWRSAHVPG